jgi:hypothetical protein
MPRICQRLNLRTAGYLGRRGPATSLPSRTIPLLAFVLVVIAVGVGISSCAGTGAGQSTGATYYVRPAGSDHARGTSRATAWRTVARVNRARLRPGDTVLFQGGAVFTDSTLIPPASGTNGHPIVFSSYGRGMARIVNADGAVWVPRKHDLRFERLRLSSDGSPTPVVAGSRGGSRDIEVSHSVIGDSRGAGIIAPSRQDADWQLTCNDVTDVGDSGLIIVGSGFVVTGNLIRDTGWNTSLDYGKHGIYAKGDAPVIRSNVIENFADSGISLRAPDSRVEDNTIVGGPIAIGFVDESIDVGHSSVEGNIGYGITTAGFYFAPDPPAPGRPAAEQFTVSNNTFALTAEGRGLDVRSAPPRLLAESGNTTDVRAPTAAELADATGASRRGCTATSK